MKYEKMGDKSSIWAVIKLFFILYIIRYIGVPIPGWLFSTAFLIIGLGLLSDSVQFLSKTKL